MKKSLCLSPKQVNFKGEEKDEAHQTLETSAEKEQQLREGREIKPGEKPKQRTKGG